MFRLLAAAIGVCLTVSAVAAEPAPFTAGVAEFHIDDRQGARMLEGHVWYPSMVTGEEEIVRDSRVWQPVTGHIDARIAPGRFPLLVISHGMFGNSLNQSWLASALAKQGYVVAMPNHPGTSTFERTPAEATRLWERAVDLSRTISFLLEDDRLGAAIDRERIAAAGHSLGGYTVMLAVGARHNVSQHAEYCALLPMRPDCQAFADWQIGRSADDVQQLEASHRDPLIKAAISLDLGGTQALDRTSLAEIDIPILVLGSGRQDMLLQDAESRALSAALPEQIGHHVELENTGHFDFMGLCTPQGYQILRQEEPGDEIVCISGVADRMARHDSIVRRIAAFLAGEGL